MDETELERLRRKYAGADIHDPAFAAAARGVFDAAGTRLAPFAGIPTFASLPYRPDFTGLQVAVAGVPMDNGVSNRPGARFGPRALRTMERIGPYNDGLGCTPGAELRCADVGDVPFRSRFDLDGSHEDIEQFVRRLVEAGAAPLLVGGDHSISHPVLRALGAGRPVGMVHIDAHCDTGGPFDGTRFHHGGPFRNAVLDGVLDPRRTVQIGIRGPAGYLWEFSADSGMTVIRADELTALGIEAVVARARALVGDGPTYLSFDIDSLDPAFAPGTGTPEVGGLSTREALAILRGLRGVNLVGGDVVEVAPQYDATTNTAQAGAQVLFEILSLMVFSPSINPGIGARTP